jgi:hypothetical protein
VIRRFAGALRAAIVALAGVAALTAFAPAAMGQQPVIRLDDAGPGAGPALLAAAIARPHRVIAPAANEYLFARGDTVPQTVIVLGRDAVVEGAVHGDVIVVAGDLYMHPGGHIDGRALAFGGGVYESSLATIGGDIRAFRDFTYDITPFAGGFALRYRPLSVETVPAFALAGFYGVSIPTYDRSNGLSLPIGVDVTPAGLPLTLSPRITYRSQLGRVDPSLSSVFALGSRDTINAFVGRATFSNDVWIRSDLINSGLFLLTGDDTRNYYRASRVEATLDRAWEFTSTTVHGYIGGRAERASSVRPGLNPGGGPWTFLGRDEAGDVLRPNPPIDDGSTYSALAGGRAQWNGGDVVAYGSAAEEIGSGAGRAFGQTTLDGTIAFPTFGVQSLSFELHGVITAGRAPRQRYAYLGGPGTMSTLAMLELGGDQLAFFDARYNIPIERFQLPFIGPPTLTLREALGGAAIGGFPTILQASGVRLADCFLYAVFMVDPARGHGHMSAVL